MRRVCVFVLGCAVTMLQSMYGAGNHDYGVTVTVVNGTSRDQHVALATDYMQYAVPGMGSNYMSIDPITSRETSPWITGWKKVKKGETKRLHLSAQSLCPEYLVVKPQCTLKGDKMTTFDNAYDAIMLVDHPQKAGSSGAYTCSGNVTVTFAKADSSKHAKSCQAIVTVSRPLQPGSLLYA